MSMLTRWEPFRESRRMHEMLDRIMDRGFLGLPWMEEALTGTLPVDMYQTENEVVVKAPIPGMKAEDIHLSITGDTLTIRGEVSEERETKEEKGVQYHIREWRSRSFSRSLILPTSINPDKAVAEFENGMLTLTLPKVEEVKPKTIVIKAKK